MTPEEIRQEILATGAIAAGFADADAADPRVARQFAQWLRKGGHAEMQWLERHEELRKDPRSVLPDATTVISIAYPYFQPVKRHHTLPRISMYAYGKDYHDVVRKRLRPLCRRMEEATGCSTRICVDSAPVPERYWAMQAGIGRLADNGTIIVDGYGSFVFLCEILTSLHLTPDTPSTLRCLHCGRCRNACPGKAILPDATLMSERCLSYLTIESDKGLPPSLRCHDTLYGCDICQTVCPHNAQADPSLILPEFLPVSDDILTLTADQARQLTPLQWEELTAGSAMKRSRKFLPRNASHLPPDPGPDTSVPSDTPE